MSLKPTLLFIAVLFLHTSSIGQNSADRTENTFYLILNSTQNYFEQADSIILSSETSILKIPHFESQLKQIRESIEAWTNLIEKLTDLRYIALGSAIGTLSILFIMQSIIYIQHYSKKLCCT
jgi:hypothetical protein